MVMGRRPEVPTAPAPIAAMTVVGFVEQLTTALATVPLRQPWAGSRPVLDNIGMTVTRSIMRSFMGYATSLPTPEFRSLEMVLDDVCRFVMPPFVRGGYIGPSPAMYSAFAAWLAREACAEIVIADSRLAPEFPFPAGLLDAIAVYEALLEEVDASRLLVAGDSGGGGLATSLMLDARAGHLPTPAGLLLFSPEVDLQLDAPSVTEFAADDILPWNIPVGSYLHGAALSDARLDVADADLAGFPPTLVVYGGREMFRDPIRSFVGHLERDGVDTTAVEGRDLFHVYPILMPWLDASRRAYRAAAEFIDEHVEAHQPD